MMIEENNTPNELAYLQATLTKLNNRLDAQETTITDLRTQITQLKSNSTANQTSTKRDTTTTSRRHLLKRMAGAAAGLATVSIIAQPQNAQAATLVGDINNPNEAAVYAINRSTTGQSLGLYAESKSPNGWAILGKAGATAGAGKGVWGENYTPSGIGVFGSSTATTGNNIGVGGESSSSTGQGLAGYVSSTTGNTIGVWGDGSPSPDGYGAVFVGGKAPLRLLSNATPASPATGNHYKGELFVDSTGSLWYCAADGTPGTWRKVAGTTSAGTLHYLPVSDRFVDTRSGLGGFNSTIMPGGIVTFNIGGATGQAGQTVPAKAVGIVGNITIVGPTGNGFTKVLPGGAAASAGTSTINYNAGFNTANSFNCPLDSTGRITVAVFGAGTVNLIIDVIGYCL